VRQAGDAWKRSLEAKLGIAFLLRSSKGVTGRSLPLRLVYLLRVGLPPPKAELGFANPPPEPRNSLSLSLSLSLSGPGRPSFWRTPEESRKRLSSVSLKINTQHTLDEASN
jgi:hypothetical protein